MRTEATIRVLFMGTPDFAAPSLRALTEQANAGLSVAGVVTRPDKPAGRGRQVAFSPVKQFALEHDIPVYQPGPLRKPEALALLCDLAPDLIVVAAFGQILPPDVLAPAAAWLSERPRLAAAALAWRLADQRGHPRGRCRDGRDDHADGCGAGHRANACARAPRPSAPTRRRAS